MNLVLDVCVREPFMDPVIDVCVREPIMDPVLAVCVREPIMDPVLAVCVREPIMDPILDLRTPRKHVVSAPCAWPEPWPTGSRGALLDYALD